MTGRVLGIAHAMLAMLLQATRALLSTTAPQTTAAAIRTAFIPGRVQARALVILAMLQWVVRAQQSTTALPATVAVTIIV